MSSPLSESTQRALSHLKLIKPYDGWSVESRGSRVRLLRRSVALTDTYFLDIHYDSLSDTVVGIMESSGQAQVLVDTNGQPCRTEQIVTAKTWKAQQPAPRTSAATRTSTTRTRGGAAAPNIIAPEDNEKILMYGLYTLGAAIAFKIAYQAMFVVYILFFPLVYLYAVNKCPPNESFDAKKELKRVLRGYHLPEDDPNKPKGFLSETMARVQATLATELATGLGYQVTMINIIGACTLTTVRVPSLERDCYWIGAFDNWYYLFQRPIPQETNNQ